MTNVRCDICFKWGYTVGMRFEVPQFINVEDKLFGPFTFKQSIYLVGGGGMIFLIYRLLPSFVVFILGIPIAAFTLALVFYKPNGRPFIKMVESYVLYIFTQKFYIWRQKDPKNIPEQEYSNIPENILPPTDTGNSNQKISDLAWSLDILDFEDK